MIQASDQEKATRRWHLVGYGKVARKTVVIHDSTCVGDHALDVAMRDLEQRPECVRLAVELA